MDSLVIESSQNEKITFTVEMETPLQMAYHYIEYLVVDNRSANHGELRRLTLKNYGRQLHNSSMHEVLYEMWNCNSQR